MMSGKVVKLHRALRQLPLSPSRLIVVFLLPVLFNYVTWQIRNLLSSAWRIYFEFWLQKLEIPGSVSMKTVSLIIMDLILPNLEAESKAPHAVIWWSILGITITIALLTNLINERYLPLKYFLRLCCIIQITSIIYFLVISKSFPFSVPSYVNGLLESTIFFLILIPWIHAGIYYVLDFSIFQKGLLTFLTLLFVILSMPSLVMIHIYFLSEYSLILLPLLYFLFGVWPLFFECIALYGWAMSWQSCSSGDRSTHGMTRTFAADFPKI